MRLSKLKVHYGIMKAHHAASHLWRMVTSVRLVCFKPGKSNRVEGRCGLSSLKNPIFLRRGRQLMRIKLLFAILCLTSTGHLLAQASPSANQPRLPLTVGFGYSNFDTDWNGRIWGPALTINWNSLPIKGLGIALEGRHLAYGTSLPNFRYNTVAGGPVYTFRSYKKFQPFGEFLVGLGGINFHLPNSSYSHDTRSILVPGGGAKYQILPSVWVRGTYEYQIWPDMFSHHALTPNGFTIGGAYDFGPMRRRTY
jgi:hypothetical protein